MIYCVYRRSQTTINKRPVSAVAARKNRGNSGNTMLNNFSRVNDLSRTRPKHMMQDKVLLYLYHLIE